MKGVKTGNVEHGILTKQLRNNNILRKPEPSFTIDAALYDSNKEKITRVVMVYGGRRYWLAAEEFDRLKKYYDYGNGAGYRVPISEWRN
jgi:hypothetical protein